jgi:ribose 5-phosphate isomerase B
MRHRTRHHDGGEQSEGHPLRRLRRHILNDANMLSIGVRVVGEGLALDIVDTFLTTQFEGGRHATRIEMIQALEE